MCYCTAFIDMWQLNNWTTWNDDWIAAIEYRPIIVSYWFGVITLLHVEILYFYQDQISWLLFFSVISSNFRSDFFLIKRTTNFLLASSGAQRPCSANRSWRRQRQATPSWRACPTTLLPTPPPLLTPACVCHRYRSGNFFGAGVNRRLPVTIDGCPLPDLSISHRISLLNPQP